MNILIIDDDEISVKGIRDYCKDQGWIVKVDGFEESYGDIIKFDPDVIVLDWCEDATGEVSGGNFLKKIWKNGYRPIVIFSGQQDLIDLKEYQKSSLLRSYPKGDESPVIKYLKDNYTFFDILSEYRSQVGEALIEAFNVLKPIRDQHESFDPSTENDTIKYLLARRTMEYFDLENRNIPLPQWGMYNFPPIANGLTTCDIIRKSKDIQQDTSAEDYRIILTPSCDLFISEGREAKVDEVLCAKCFSIDKFIDKIPGGDSKRGKNHINNALTTGYYLNLVPLPAMINMCPPMCADMKKLELIPLDHIAKNDQETDESKEYLRVAGISSPFREQIVWAYMQSACRPGVQDRDFGDWVQEIVGK